MAKERVIPDPRNPFGEIQNPEKKFISLEERTGNRPTEFETRTLNEMIGWDQESAMFAFLVKKLSANHRRNRKGYGSRNTKHVRYMRDPRRPGKEEE